MIDVYGLTDDGESVYIHEEGIGLGSALVTRIIRESIQQAKEAIALLPTTKAYRDPPRRQNTIHTTTETPPQEAFMSVFNVNATVEE